MGIKEESRLAEMLPAHLGDLSILERKVANYLLRHEDRIQGMDIADIAKAADVSKATVVRFCKALGFKGLKDFKIYYEAGKSAYPEKIKKISKDSDPQQINQTLQAGICKAVDKTLTEENLASLMKIASELQAIDKVTLIYSDASLVSDCFVSKLECMGVELEQLSIPEFISEPRKVEGMLFIVSHLEDNNPISWYIKKAKDESVPVSVLTFDSKSWMSVNADNLLIPFSERILDDDKLILARLSTMMLFEELSILLAK